MNKKELLKYSSGVIYRDLSSSEAKKAEKEKFFNELSQRSGFYFYLIDSNSKVHESFLSNDELLDQLLFMSSEEAGSEANTFLLCVKNKITAKVIDEYLVALTKSGGLSNPANLAVICKRFDGSLLLRDNDGHLLYEVFN